MIHYKGLEIHVDFNASGSGRGYYETNYDQITQDLNSYLKTVKYSNKDELSELVAEFLDENSHNYQGEFVFSRCLDETTIISVDILKQYKENVIIAEKDTVIRNFEETETYFEKEKALYNFLKSIPFSNNGFNSFLHREKSWFFNQWNNRQIPTQYFLCICHNLQRSFSSRLNKT